MKILTGIGFAICLMLLVSWPWTVGGIPPKGSEAIEYHRYKTRATWAIGGIVVAFFGSAIGSALIVRKVKNEFREESAENLRRLIEGATEDIRKKNEAANR